MEGIGAAGDHKETGFVKFLGTASLGAFPFLEFLTQSFKDVPAIKQDNACSIAGTGTV